MARLVTGLLGCLDLIVEYWIFEKFRVVQVIWVPKMYTRIIQNKFEFSEVLPEIEFFF